MVFRLDKSIDLPSDVLQTVGVALMGKLISGQRWPTCWNCPTRQFQNRAPFHSYFIEIPKIIAQRDFWTAGSNN
jgi:hypothetical protein